MAGLLSLLGILLVLAGITLARLAFQAMGARREAGRRADVEADRAGILERAVAERTRELREANERLHAEATTRANAEAQLHQAQKMEAIGQLTGGIAHDFNNMLAVIVGGLERTKRRLPETSRDLAHHLDQALDGADRAAALTKRLLAFARAEPLRPEDVDAGELIRGMLDLLDRTLGEQVHITTRIMPERWMIWCDPHQLENALLNLAVNARDALANGGNLLISTDNVRLNLGQVGELPPGDYLRIDVRDDGCGMDKAVLERAFEPFFTTKAVGKGTGLGLSQTFGFVRQSAGEIVIRSQPGAGTCVSLFLPRYTGSTRSLADATATALPVRDGAGETVLVVEDDARVRTSTVEALEELGYQPLPCGNGEEALALLAVRRDIRLVVSDVVMPGMTGPQLVDRIKSEYPEIAAIFVTGYVGDADSGDRLRGHDVLRKPFTMSGLAMAVATALDARQSAGQTV
jgi:signal transduction histidine kinase/ActR/RegA family two-component response regulator